jgi:hypothetical protein
MLNQPTRFDMHADKPVEKPAQDCFRKMLRKCLLMVGAFNGIPDDSLG